MDAVQIRNLKLRLQLSDLAQKSVEPIALKACRCGPAGIPGLNLWDEDVLRRRLQAIVAREHTNPHSIGIIDETTAQEGSRNAGCPAVGSGAGKRAFPRWSTVPRPRSPSSGLTARSGTVRFAWLTFDEWYATSRSSCKRWMKPGRSLSAKCMRVT
jgi:hypothetical protein